MKLQKQLYDHDCLVACICSLLDININTAPLFNKFNDEEFWQKINNWLIKNYNYFILTITWKSYIDYLEIRKLKNNIVIVAGDSPYQNGIMHAVLYKNDKLFFDPSKENKGIIGKPKHVDLLVPVFNIKNKK